MEAITMKYSEPELNAAFKRVQSPVDWRAPIDCIVREADPGQLDLIAEAVMFYTATPARIVRRRDGTRRVMADGYRQGPAGP